MIVYYTLYAILSFAGLVYIEKRAAIFIVFWIIIFPALVLFIGFRYEVGGDWFSYDAIMRSARIVGMFDALTLAEPGYAFFNWISAEYFGSIYFVNIVCAVIFSLGLLYFCVNQPRPLLALSVSFPYIIIVISMGYTRQSAAFGLELMAILYLERSNVKIFLVLIAFGALFHKSVVIMIVLLLFTQKNSRFVTLAIVSAFVYVVFTQFGSEYGVLYENYVTTERSSSGALVRGIMSIIPSVGLLISQRSIDFNESRLRVWRAIAILNIGIFPVVFFASTAADRLMLYFIPIQVYFFARIPNLTKKMAAEMLAKFAIVSFYCIALVVWLNYADNASAWIPYRTELF